MNFLSVFASVSATVPLATKQEERRVVVKSSSYLIQLAASVRSDTDEWCDSAP